jgi:hypothetical protein
MYNPQLAAAFRDQIKASQQLSKSGQAIKGAFTDSGKITEGMNKSFQGMQAKGSAIQKIISTIWDTMSIGTTKLKKDIMGVIGKAIKEGDIAGMIQGLMDSVTQYIDMSGLDKPFEMLFRPFSIMLTTIGAQAAGIIATSESFQEMMAYLASPEGMADMADFAQRLAEAALKLMNMDLNSLMMFIEFAVDEIEKLADAAKFFNPRMLFYATLPADQRDAISGINASSGGSSSSSSGIASSSSKGNVNFQTAVMSESQMRRLVNAIRTRMVL